jgi:hypothetical protein
MKNFLLLTLIALLSLFSCERQSTEIISTVNGFEIFKLADSTITTKQAQHILLDSLVLSQFPFLTEDDLVAYYWASHTFTTHPDIDTLFSRMRWLPGKSAGVPFVVVAGNSRIYQGAFWWPYSSSLPPGAYIMIGFPPPYAIQFESFSSLPDLRDDRRIYDVLKESGVLVE